MKKSIHPGIAAIVVVVLLAVGIGVWFMLNRDPTAGAAKPLDDTNSFVTAGGKRMPKMAGAAETPTPSKDEGTQP